MEYNTVSLQTTLSDDSGVPRQSSDAREEDQTYVKKLIPGKLPASSVSMFESYTSNSVPSLPGQGMNYNEVKVDVNTSQYVSGKDVRPHVLNPNYVDFHPKVDKPAHMDVGDVINQIAASKAKNPDSGNNIHIGQITIYNGPQDPTYYGHMLRQPPDPCLPHPYDYPDQPRAYQGRRKSAEEEIYMGIPGGRTPVENSGPLQSSVEEQIDPYRETVDFVNNSRPTRSNSTRSQDTQPSPRTRQRDAEPVQPHDPQENPTRMTLQPRNSPDGAPGWFDVQLVMKGSNQRWTGELKPSQTEGLHSRSPSIETLDSVVTYDSHRQTRDRNRHRVPYVLENTTTPHHTDQSPTTEPSQRRSYDGDRRMAECGDNTLIKSPVVAEEPHRDTVQRVTRVDNPIYMADQPYRSTNTLTSSAQTQNVLGHSGGMEPSRAGANWNGAVERPISQSAPDIRELTPLTNIYSRPPAIHRPNSFPNKLKLRGHECVVEGFFNIHDDKAIEDAKKRLELDGKDGDWLMTSAVRQPMHSFCLNVRLQNKTNTFPINNLKGKKISIDTTSKKSFKCLCALISYYTKKTLPNQEVHLGNAFQLQRPSGVYELQWASGPCNSSTEVSHL